MIDILARLRELLNNCRYVEGDPDGKWKIMRCRVNHNLTYMIVVENDEKKYVVEAYKRAKQRGYIDELTTVYVLQCGDWAGIMGILMNLMSIVVSDYSRRECMDRFMEIVDNVTKELSEVEE